MLIMDQIAYNSKLRDVMVKQKIYFIILPMLCALFADSNALNIFTIFVMGCCTIYFAQISLLRYLKFILVPLIFVFMSVLTISIVALHDYNNFYIPMFKLFGTQYAITMASLNLGMHIFFKSLASISCLYFFALNTPMNSLLSYLQQLGVSSLILVLMEFIYRFIFILYAQAQTIRIAQQSRLGYQGWRNSFRTYCELFSTVFIHSLSKVDRMNNALLSRGFNNNFSSLSNHGIHSIQIKQLTYLNTILLLIGFFLERGVI